MDVIAWVPVSVCIGVQPTEMTVFRAFEELSDVCVHD